MSKWKFYPRDRTEEEAEEEDRFYKERELPPGMNREFFEEFFGAIGECKKKVLGLDANVTLGVLATRPEHSRRGIGAMHLNWGLQQADEVSLVISDSRDMCRVLC